ncbi:hypothetical protein PISMIDRAFT_675136 [Pisolithus microcarpus 441]|uniref:Uncharacterized protein n=1 Tax=Pisolithus microcarpus 441 TaxID=765257 RepID=A0A0C9YQB5_9AGAM|nr:hypothetical protein PISMIDRAFT_675136 [Pisolithus microcarpus 441]
MSYCRPDRGGSLLVRPVHRYRKASTRYQQSKFRVCAAEWRHMCGALSNLEEDAYNFGHQSRWLTWYESLESGRTTDHDANSHTK